MDIIVITSGTRKEYLTQTLDSMQINALDMSKHNLVVSIDGAPSWDRQVVTLPSVCNVYIKQSNCVGASACRNIGAASIPKYRRQSTVMFLDDDTYLLPCWDYLLERTLELLPNSIISGHAHPFNHSQGHYQIREIEVEAAQVLSTVHYVMPWNIWDAVGPFKEPGGPGGSEDIDWCARAAKLGYGMAVTDPMCVVHCGLTNSSGAKLVGYDLMMDMNRKLVASYGLEGKVEYA